MTSIAINRKDRGGRPCGTSKETAIVLARRKHFRRGEVRMRQLASCQKMADKSQKRTIALGLSTAALGVLEQLPSDLDRHIRGSSSREERFGFRLYFFWDDEGQQAVVGSFPTHLSTRAS